MTDTDIKKRLDYMEVKLVTQCKKLRQALEQNQFMKEDLEKIKKALEEAKNSEEEKT